jgi:hypothetical protein
VDLPHTKTKIKFREITTQEQILLAKANLNFPAESQFLYEYNKFILDIISKCVEDFNLFQNINIVEYVLFLIKLRIISVGGTIEFLLKDQERKTKVLIDFKKYMLNLFNGANYFDSVENNIITDDKFTIKLNWPKLSALPLFNTFLLENKNELDLLNGSLQEFIEFVKFENFKIDFNNIDNDKKIKLFEKLPMHIVKTIQEKTLNALKQLFEYDLFEISVFKDQKFNFYNLNFIEHIKMAFSYDVKSLYQEIFFMSSYNLPPDYILSISPSERSIYSSIIEEQNKKREGEKDPMSESIKNDVSQDVKDLALEFGEDIG